MACFGVTSRTHTVHSNTQSHEWQLRYAQAHDVNSLRQIVRFHTYVQVQEY